MSERVFSCSSKPALCLRWLPFPFSSSPLLLALALLAFGCRRVAAAVFGSLGLWVFEWMCLVRRRQGVPSAGPYLFCQGYPGRCDARCVSCVTGVSFSFSASTPAWPFSCRCHRGRPGIRVCSLSCLCVVGALGRAGRERGRASSAGSRAGEALSGDFSLCAGGFSGPAAGRGRGGFRADFKIFQRKCFQSVDTFLFAARMGHLLTGNAGSHCPAKCDWVVF